MSRSTTPTREADDDAHPAGRRARFVGAAVLVVAVGVVALATAPSGTARSDTEPSDTAPSDTAPSDTAPSGTGAAPGADEVRRVDVEETVDPPAAAVVGALGHEVDAARDLVSLWDAPPALEDLDGWLQADAYGTPVEGLADLAGAPATIVQFWTFGCRNCTATLPFVGAVEEHYRDDGVRVVGVHAPEFAFEEDPAAVAAAARDLGVTWPIALDTRRTNFRAWQPDGPNFWPRTYVLDAAGRVVYDEIGEGGYERLEDTVATLVAGGATTPRGDDSHDVDGGR